MRQESFSLSEVSLWILTISACLLFGAVHQSTWPFLGLFVFIPFLIHPSLFLKIANLPSPFMFGMGLVGLWVLFQSFFVAWNPYATTQSILRWIILGTSFLFVRTFSDKAIVRWLGIFFILGVLESLYGIFQVQSGSEHVLWRAKEAHQGFVTGTYLNRNHFAGFLELCIGSSLGLWFTAFVQGKKMQSIAIGAGLLVMLAALFQSASRMGLASLLIASLFYIILLFRSSQKIPRIGTFLFVLFVIVSLGLAREAFSLRMTEIQDQWAQWEGGRFWVWRDLGQMISTHLWTGVGLGNFETAYPSYQSAALVMKWAHAHNDYLELITELGVVGASLFWASWGTLIFSCFQQLKKLQSSHYFLGWGILVGITSISIHGMADFNFAVPANALLFVLLAGALSKLCESEVGAS